MVSVSSASLLYCLAALYQTVAACHKMESQMEGGNIQQENAIEELVPNIPAVHSVTQATRGCDSTICQPFTAQHLLYMHVPHA